MANDPEAGKSKSPAERRKDFFESRFPEMLKEKVEAREARRKLNEVIQEASDSFVLTRGKVRDISGRDQILKELFEELDKLKVSEEDREKCFIESQWKNRRGEQKHRLFLRNDIAVELSGKTVTFSPEEVESMENFILQIRTLQNEISKIMANPEGTIDLSQQAGETEEERAARIAQEAQRVGREKKEQAVRESEKILNPEDNPYERVRKEATGGAIKILEQKTGHSLEFSPDQHSHIQKYLNERFADVMAARAEDYLRRKRGEVAKRGIDPEARGVAAVKAVETLGATKEIIEGDRELEKIHIVLTALSEFSRGDIPPSARFAILEQLNQLPDSDEVKKLRVEVFQKWSGREPEIQQPAFDIEIEQRFNTLFNAKLQEQVANLSAEERSFGKLLVLNVPETEIAKMKYIGCGFRRIPPGWLDKIFNYDGQVIIIRNGVEIDPFTTRGQNEYRNLLNSLDTLWKDKIKQEEGPRMREKVKLEYDSAFVSDVTNVSERVLKKRYESLRDDIDAEFAKKLIESKQSGEKVTQETDEALAETGKGSMQFVRSMVAGEGAFGNLSGDVQKDGETLLKELKDNWDLDIPPEQFDRFIKESGMDYNVFSKKPTGLVYFMLRLVSHALQEAKKINV